MPKPEPKKRGRKPKPEDQTEPKPKRPRGRPRKDATRKSYLNYYCSGKWGDSRNYDLCINSSNPGVDGVVDLIELLVEKRIKQ